jgi:low temperature requirement protein LtrA
VAEKKSLLRSPDMPMEPAFLELFFDVIYVFALTQLTERLTGHLNFRGAVDALVLLLALWWVWVLTAWLSDRFSPQRTVVQVQVLFVMFAVFLMAIVVRSIDQYSLLFAITYLAITFVRVVFVLFAARGTDLPNRSKRVTFWFALSAPAWITGGVTHGWARDLLWLLALAMDYGSAALRWPTPGLGRAPGWELEIAPRHLAERYRQLFIVALGEIFLSMGLTFTRTGSHTFAVGRTTVLALSSVSTVLMWRLYIYRAGAQLGPAIAASRDPHRLSQWSSYLHMVMVAGILLTATGFTLIIEHPTAQPPLAWIAGIAGGPALFLAGRAGFEYVIFGRLTPPRLIGIVLLAVIAATVVYLPPTVTSAAATLVLAGVAAFDTLRAHHVPPEPPSPPA